ncbi:RNA polymerase sigma-70 factor, ECF subfamily [bacterium A37T11]|nr:RNA polymerase sigma-70 factor, ECF subfamily [bacterium A37T11]
MAMKMTPIVPAANPISMKDSATFEHMFRNHHVALCMYASRITHSSDDAEDIVEEVFMQCWNNGQLFDNEEHAGYFLYRAVKNAALNHLKIQKRAANKYVQAAKLYDDTEESHLNNLIRAEVICGIYEHIASLPPQEEKVMLLSVRENKKLQEIAEELSLSLQTVKNCKSRALKHLRLKFSWDDNVFLIILLISWLF